MDVVSLARETFREPGPLRSRGKTLLEQACAACEAAEATFWVVSPAGTELLGALNVGRTPVAVEEAEVPISGSLIGMVASLQLAASNGPESSFNRSVDKATGTSTEAMVAAPVRVGGRLCGVLSAINPSSGSSSFSARQLDALKLKARELGRLAAEAVPDDAGFARS